MKVMVIEEAYFDGAFERSATGRLPDATMRELMLEALGKKFDLERIDSETGGSRCVRAADRTTALEQMRAFVVGLLQDAQIPGGPKVDCPKGCYCRPVGPVHQVTCPLIKAVDGEPVEPWEEPLVLGGEDVGTARVFLIVTVRLLEEV